MVGVDNLVGVQEIARRLDVREAAVKNWCVRGVGFPDPCQVLGMGQVWDWPDVEAWAQQTGRLGLDGTPMKKGRTGRPKKVTT